MPYGTPTESGTREYKVTLASVDTVGGYPATITCVATADNNNDPDMADVFQKFVDLIGDGGTHFTNGSGSRVKHFTESVTPTP